MYIDEPPTNAQLSQFLHTMDVLNKARKQAPWDMADLLIDGVNAFVPQYFATQRELCEVVYEQLSDCETQVHTLENYISVARRYPSNEQCKKLGIKYRRRERLSISHHLEVSTDDREEQDYWLDLAESNAWSVFRLRMAMKGNREEQLKNINPDTRFDAEQLFHYAKIPLHTDLREAIWKVDGYIVRVQSASELKWTISKD